MSDLTEAMRAAVDSVDAERHPRSGPGEVRAHRTSVTLRDESDLPPVRHRPAAEPQTITAIVREQFGTAAAIAFTAVREALVMVVLFWVVALLLAFAEVEGRVPVPGVGEATVITAALLGATVLRAVLVAVGRAATIERRRR